MCYPVCGMMHIKEPLLLIRKSSPCGGSRFTLSLLYGVMKEGDIFYLMAHSTHFIYSLYGVRKEIILFNNILKTFSLQLCGVRWRLFYLITHSTHFI